MWDIKTTEQALEVEFSNRQFEISAICHPATYLNKILLGSEQGSLQVSMTTQSIKLATREAFD